MESLYRKYRPQTFEDVVGQQHVVSTLERAVTEGRTSHAYLFCGPRGTGKTTMARILAKALECERGAGHLPDGTCEECQLIATGDHPDVYELDAASRTGVDNVREEIINRVDYAPVRGRYKVYIIDEVHMLTPAAFNALLKTLEEPPAHVVFIMCTTDPQKVLPTILSRVQRFDFRPIGAAEMREHLADICKREDFSYEDEAIELVVRHARGGMRDAISTLEQLSVFGDGAITAAAARDLLGEVSNSRIAVMSMALAKRDVPTMFAEVAGLVNGGGDLLQFTRELMARVRNVYVVSLAGAQPGVVDATPGEEERLGEEAAAFGGADRLARVLTVLDDAALEMRAAANQRLTLEVALTRAARPESDLTLEALAERLEALEARVASGTVAVAAAGVAASAPVTAGVAATAPVAAPRSAPAPAPRPTPAPQPTPAPTAPKPAPVSSPVADSELQRTWKGMVGALLKTNASCASLLLNASAEADDGSTLTISLPAGSAFTRRMLERADVRAIVDKAVADAFGPRTLSYGDSGAPARPSSAASVSRPEAAAPLSQPKTSAPAPVPASAASEPASVQPAVPSPTLAPVATPAPEPASAIPVAPAVPAPASAAAAAVPAEPAPAEPAAPAAAAPAPESADDEPPYDDADAFLPDDEPPFDGGHPVAPSRTFAEPPAGSDGAGRALASTAPVPSRAAKLKIPDIARGVTPAPSAPPSAVPTSAPAPVPFSAPQLGPTPAVLAPSPQVAGPQATVTAGPADAASSEVPATTDELISMFSEVFGKTKATIVDESNNPIGS